jgi:hypothetical protein
VVTVVKKLRSARASIWLLANAASSPSEIVPSLSVSMSRPANVE